MSELLLTNVFFIITGTAVIVLTMLGALILFQVLRILRKLEEIIEKTKQGAEHIAEDIAAFKEELTNGGVIARIIGQVLNFGMYRGADAPPKRSRQTRAKKTTKKATRKTVHRDDTREDY